MSLPATSLSPRRVVAALAVLATLAGCGHAGAPWAPAGPEPGLSASGKKPADGYYASVGALMGQALLKQLQTITRRGHRELSYDDARDQMFGRIDDPSNQDRIVTLYTGWTVKGISDRLSAFHRGVNAEHAWPQSKGAWGIAKSDLHHLFPAEADVNSTRNNWPLGVVAKVERVLPSYVDGEASKLGYAGGSGASANRKIFEPRASLKGDLARAILYFYMRYGRHGTGKATTEDILTDNFAVEQATLLRWHQQDPVSEAERARNQAIYAVQGNRNPFVDHPEYVSKVGTFLPKGKALDEE